MFVEIGTLNLQIRSIGQTFADSGQDPNEEQLSLLTTAQKDYIKKYDVEWQRLGRIYDWTAGSSHETVAFFVRTDNPAVVTLGKMIFNA